jgi:hypothetical protein
MSLRLVATAAAGLFAGAVQAAPLTFFGENQAACATPGVRATCAVSGNPLTARNTFQSFLVSGIGVENFESYANGAGSAAGLPITFTGSTGNITATINPSAAGGTFVSDGTTFGGFSDTENFGRWNTTPAGGDSWYLAFNSFSIDFDVAISAFGFYGTDVGDINGQMTITLRSEAGVNTVINVGNTANSPNSTLMFWGFVDPTVKYNRITFGNTAAGFDGFGFDGMTIGDQGQVTGVPEPGSLALVGLSLAALGAARRRKA